MRVLQIKILHVMLNHLKTKGYPNLTDQQILDELKPMWDKLGQARLLQAHWKYEDYVKLAHMSKLRADLKEEFLKHLGQKTK